MFLSPTPDRHEIWFSASRDGARLELHAVTLSGKERLVGRLPTDLRIQDVAPDGSALVSLGTGTRWELRGRMAGDATERDLTWLDGTCMPTLSRDGSQMLFMELGEAGGTLGTGYHWRMGGPPPTRLGSGAPTGVSPDWSMALVLSGVGNTAELALVPIGAGETATLPRGPIRQVFWGLWHPDGRRVFTLGADAVGKIRVYVLDATGGLPRPVPGLDQLGQITPDGRYIAVRSIAKQPFALLPVEGGEARPIPHLKAGEIPVVFADDGNSLYVRDEAGAFPVRVVRLDLTAGKREPWLELRPPDLTGVQRLPGHVWLTPNGRFYAYGYWRKALDLFLVEGLR